MGAGGLTSGGNSDLFSKASASNSGAAASHFGRSSAANDIFSSSTPILSNGTTRKRYNGKVIMQDESSSRFNGMSDSNCFSHEMSDTSSIFTEPSDKSSTHCKRSLFREKGSYKSFEKPSSSTISHGNYGRSSNKKSDRSLSSNCYSNASFVSDETSLKSFATSSEKYVNSDFSGGSSSRSYSFNDPSLNGFAKSAKSSPSNENRRSSSVCNENESETLESSGLSGRVSEKSVELSLSNNESAKSFVSTNLLGESETSDLSSGRYVNKNVSNSGCNSLNRLSHESFKASEKYSQSSASTDGESRDTDTSSDIKSSQPDVPAIRNSVSITLISEEVSFVHYIFNRFSSR